MRFDEMLQICLLAQESRYPGCVVEGNAVVLAELALPDEAITPTQMLEWLQASDPRLLQAHARLLVDEQQSSIYLLAISEGQPAFWLYCGGCSPRQREKQRQRA